MLAALQQDSGYQYRASFGTRVLSAVLALGIIALMILALMRLGVLPPIAEKPEVKSTTFVLTPEPKTANHTRSAVQTRHVTSGGAPRKLAPVAKAPPTPKAPVPWNVTPLTQQEFALLEYLCRNAGRVVTRAMVLDHVWKMRIDTSTNIVDVHIHRLRAKVDRESERPLIRTIRGVGYLLQD